MIRALNTIALVFACVLAVALYRAKTEAQDARERVDTLQAQIMEERRSTAVLRAEIAYLERPERLRALARKYLGLDSVSPEQEVDLETVLMKLQGPDAVHEVPQPSLRPDVRLAGGQGE